MCAGSVAFAQEPNQMFRAAGSPENPKVAVSWNKYYDYEGHVEIAKKEGSTKKSAKTIAIQ